MAPGSSALALKTAAIVSILALLVVPSFGRCGHPLPPPPPPTPAPPPPEPLPPTPAPAPGPGPTISCNDCFSQCSMTCDASIASLCSSYCDNVEFSCNQCKNTIIENCKVSGSCTGSCDCNNAASGMSCTSACTTRYCDACKFGYGQQCQEDCSKQCSAPNCIPWSPQN